MCSRCAGSTRVFNAGNGKSIAILEIVQEILRRTDSKSEIRFERVGAGDIPSLDIGFLETHGRRMKTRSMIQPACERVKKAGETANSCHQSGDSDSHEINFLITES